MHPVLSIGIYILFLLITAAQCKWCVGGRLSGWWGSGFGWLATVVVYVLLGLLPVAGALLPDSRIKFFLQAAGNIWLGFYLYFGGFLLFLCLGVWLAEKISRHLHGRARITVLVIALAVGGILLVYGMIHAQRTKVTRYELNMDKDAGETKDLRIVLLADLHMSVNSIFSTTEKLVEKVNAEQPDVILIAGDIFTSSYRALRDPQKYAGVLSSMQAKDGVFAVYGNHDVEETLFGGFPISSISQAFRTREMEQFFRDCGFTVLYDDTAWIADGQVQIVGRVDGEKAGDGTADRMSPQQVLSDIVPDQPVIVLQHEPVEFAALKENGADLALCGHTHAGQLFPGNWIVPFFNENAYGYKLVSGLDTIVTSGVGYYGPPMRVGTNSEITVVDIHFQ